MSLVYDVHHITCSITVDKSVYRQIEVVTWFKDHEIYKSHNYKLPKPQNKRYCSQYMVAIVVLKPS